MKGLICSILEDKNIGNCSNGGISTVCNKVLLVGGVKGIPEIFEPDVDCPAVTIMQGHFGRVKAVLVNEEYMTGLKGPMFGGCFIYSSDSRFPFDYPVPLHDRYEDGL